MKSSMLKRAAAIAGIAAVGTAVCAEPPIGSRLGNRVEKNQVRDERSAAETAHQLAGCIITKRGSAGRDLLNARSDAEVDKLQSKMNGSFDCIANISGNDLVEGVSVTYPPDVMRGDLAEEFLKRNRSAVSQLQPLPIQRTYSRPWFAFSGRHVSVDEMAACVADTDPVGVMALVDSAPFSDAESGAFGALSGFMGPCLRAGTTVEAKREPLRAALAEALYQRVFNPDEGAKDAVQSAIQASAK